jgi:hypothetical protein
VERFDFLKQHHYFNEIQNSFDKRRYIYRLPTGRFGVIIVPLRENISTIRWMYAHHTSLFPPGTLEKTEEWFIAFVKKAQDELDARDRILRLFH